ncbi:hypothetical protein [Aneurinibacillus tyrosinisolvens]|uniref:hypothetical protein n=1 Tax=Aneurinibacillus tyrosinisolvens TaxID=1443435 RepID=UPI00063EEFAD|nr:hypothetical protein [Aneurinibacillus tyrosinisolvens]
MARLLFMSNDTWETGLLELDIFMTGKLLFDHGYLKESSAEAWIESCGYDRDEVFIKALSIIIGSPVCVHPHNEEDDKEEESMSYYEDKVIYSIPIPQVQKWHERKKKLEKKTIAKKELAILSPLNGVDIGASFTDGEFEVELTPYGLKIWAFGSYKFYHLAIEEFFNFMECLEKELA